MYKAATIETLADAVRKVGSNKIAEILEECVIHLEVPAKEAGVERPLPSRATRSIGSGPFNGELRFD